MCWFIIGVILICITLFLLKSIQIDVGDFYEEDWVDFKIKIWMFALIIIVGFIPILNIIAAIIGAGYFTMRLTSYGGIIRLKKNSTIQSIISFIKEFLTKDLL